MAFDQAVADEICEHLSNGVSLRQICRMEGMPSYSTAKRWESENEEFRANSLRARETGCHALADECLEIADDGANDWMKSSKPDDEGYAYNGEHVQRSKLRVDTRLRLLGKWMPKVYGDRTHVEVEDVTDRAALMRQRREARKSNGQD